MSSGMLNVIIQMWSDEVASLATTLKIDADCKPLVEVEADSLLRLARNMRETAQAGMGEGNG